MLNDVSLHRLIDGAEVPVFTLSLSLDAGSWTWGFEAVLPASAEPLVDPGHVSGPVELVVRVNGTWIQTHLSRVLLQLERGKRTGALHLTAGEVVTQLVVSDGQIVFAEAAEDTSFEAMMGLQDRAAAAVRADPNVAFVASFNGGGSNTLNTGRMFITLKPRAERQPMKQVVEGLRLKMRELPGIAVRAFDWTPLIKDLAKPDDRHAAAIPADQHALLFPDFATLASLAERLDAAGTFFHFMHVLLGMVILAALWNGARQQRYHPGNMNGLESGAAYWHMVDLVRLVLFPLVSVMR